MKGTGRDQPPWRFSVYKRVGTRRTGMVGAHSYFWGKCPSSTVLVSISSCEIYLALERFFPSFLCLISYLAEEPSVLMSVIEYFFSP